jgi:wyosine [tRNA(Phe)-imidazoG37] synthetase (radical SAM superfamily)
VNKDVKMPTTKQVLSPLEHRIKEILANGGKIDTITFAGNGEPTMHPKFAQIVDKVIGIRDKFCPNAKISVLSNAIYCSKKSIFEALNKVDNNILKLDAGIEQTLQAINQPKGKFSLPKLVENLQKFNGNLIIQTLFFKGEYGGKIIDNTTEIEVKKWLDLLKKIKPTMVMLYSLDRPTPAISLQKASKESLQKIAKMVEGIGIKTQIN